MSFDDAALIAELPTLRRLARRRWPLDPELLVQMTCEAALLKRDKFRPRGDSFQSWLVMVLVNQATDLYRSKIAAKLRPATDTFYVPLDSQEAMNVGMPASQHDALMLNRAIEFLRNDGHGTELLAGALGYSKTEIASYRNVPVGTVLSRTCRARVRYREWNDQ